jgi:hypothetical protein
MGAGLALAAAVGLTIVMPGRSAQKLA